MMSMIFEPCVTKVDLNEHLIPFLQENAFYAELSRQMEKIPSKDKKCPTAVVTYEEKIDSLTLWWNPDYFSSLSQWGKRNLLMHEFMHPTLGHLTTRRLQPSYVWNCATDLAINSLIETDCLANRPSYAKKDEQPIPEEWLLPGRFPKLDFDINGKLTKEQELTLKVAYLFEKFPKNNSSEYYFEKIIEIVGSDEFDLSSIDNHDFWDQIDPEKFDYVKNRIKSIVNKSIKYADSRRDGWGNMPMSVVDYIRAANTTYINWRMVLKNFVGRIENGRPYDSIKIINRRYPYIHSGKKSTKVARILIAIDQSASVNNEMLVDFFGELSNLNKLTSIDYLPFDCSAEESNIVTWKKGQTLPHLKRILMGGTDFNAPTKIFNDNRGRWDALMIMTDGLAPEPIPIRGGKRAWVLGEKCDTHFQTKELKIKLTKERII